MGFGGLYQGYSSKENSCGHYLRLILKNTLKFFKKQKGCLKVFLGGYNTQMG